MDKKEFTVDEWNNKHNNSNVLPCKHCNRVLAWDANDRNKNFGDMPKYHIGCPECMAPRAG
jgi:hypothetical protein